MLESIGLKTHTKKCINAKNNRKTVAIQIEKQYNKLNKSLKGGFVDETK